MRQSIMAHLIEDRRQRAKEKGAEKLDTSFEGTSPNDLLPPSKPHLLPFTTSQQCYHIMEPSRDYPFIRSDSSGSNHFPKAHQQATWACGRYFISFRSPILKELPLQRRAVKS
jgi:hypothetical protein